MASESARIELIDVPFVRMRGWYEDKFRSAPPRYTELVSAVQRQSPPPEPPPRITVDRSEGLLLIEGADTVRLSPCEFAAICLQLAGVSNHAEMAERLLALKECRLPEPRLVWVDEFQASNRYFTDDGDLLGAAEAVEALRRTLSSARRKISPHPAIGRFVDILLPKREAATSYRNVRFSGPDPFADIRG